MEIKGKICGSEKILFIQSDDYKKILKNSDNEAHFKNPFVSDVFLEINEDIQKKIINFATSDFMLKTATKYLGVFPIITRINLNINVPTNKNASSSQLWHRDDFGFKKRDPFTNLSSWQKGFRTLNDTDHDIIEAYRQGKVSKEAMDKMSISVK